MKQLICLILCLCIAHSQSNIFKKSTGSGSSARSGNNCLFFFSSGNQQSGNIGNTKYHAGTGTDSISRKGCKYSEWTSTTPCSVTCGGGVQTQSRSKYEYNGADAEDCNEVLTKVKICNMKPCPTTPTTPPQVQVPEHHQSPAKITNPMLGFAGGFAGTAGLLTAAQYSARHFLVYCRHWRLARGMHLTIDK